MGGSERCWEGEWVGVSGVGRVSEQCWEGEWVGVSSVGRVSGWE